MDLRSRYIRKFARVPLHLNYKLLGLCTFCYKGFQRFWRPSLLSLASLLFSAPGVVGISAVVSVSVVTSFPAVVNFPAILLVLLPCSFWSNKKSNMQYLTMTVRLIIFCYLIIIYRTFDIETSYRTIILYRFLETQKKLFNVLFLYFNRNRLPWSLNTTN